jgi:hypothetical protein
MIPNKEIKKLRAFKGDKKLKSLMVKEIKWHQDQDKIIQGTYGDSTNPNSKFCAVGCAIDSLNRKLNKNFATGNHVVLQDELGIPKTLAYLQDSIFERLPKEIALKFPLKFIKAIPVSADLSLVAPKFIVFVLEDCIKNADDNGKVIITKIIGMWGKVIDGKPPKQSAWSAAESAAWSVAESAAWFATRSAIWSAWSAAESVAESAARSAAWSAAWSAAYGRYANKLIKLLKEAPVKK